jgi:hypothetical protein
MGHFRRWRERLAVSWHRFLLVIYLGQLMTGVNSASTFPFHPHYVPSLGSEIGGDIERLAGPVGLPKPTIKAVLA